MFAARSTSWNGCSESQPNNMGEAYLQALCEGATNATLPEAQHCADNSGANGSDEPLEARSVHRATRRTPEIIVNDFNVDEAMPARHFNQIVLATLTLQVRLHLRLRGLAHIDNSFALQERRRQSWTTTARRRFLRGLR